MIIHMAAGRLRGPGYVRVVLVVGEMGEKGGPMRRVAALRDQLAPAAKASPSIIDVHTHFYDASKPSVARPARDPALPHRAAG